MECLTLSRLKKAALADRVSARVHVQIESIAEKQTRELKPYRELVVADAETKLTLRAWNDSEAFQQCEGLPPGEFVEVEGDFTQSPAFGTEAKRWTCRVLDPAEREALLAGPPELREKQEADFEAVVALTRTISDPRLSRLAGLFLEEFGDRFRRTAAARNYHHARRGGLVEHVAQMMRAAEALGGVYPMLNKDLLLTGCLMHDIGKLWENALPENGFVMPYDERGELLGHITIGIEVVNALWRKLLTPETLREWSELRPSSEDVRLHLLHLIASHHGSLAFGSPVDPKTPEAHALHYIDNLDARLEMMAAGYQTAAHLAPRVLERVRPLPGNLVEPLPPFLESPTPEPGSATPS